MKAAACQDNRIRGKRKTCTIKMLATQNYVPRGHVYDVPLLPMPDALVSAFMPAATASRSQIVAPSNKG